MLGPLGIYNFKSLLDFLIDDSVFHAYNVLLGVVVVVGVVGVVVVGGGGGGG